MPLFRSPWWNNRDPAFVSAASAAAAVALALIIAYKQQKRIAASKHHPEYKEISSPKGRYPLFGHLLSIKPDVSLSQQLTGWHNEFNTPILQLDMGIQKWISLNDPKMAHEIFVTNGAIASSRPIMAFTYKNYALGGKGVVFTKAGKSWRNTRKAVLTILAPKMVDGFRVAIDQEVDYLIANLTKNSDPTTGVNPVKCLQLASLNLILATCFAKRAKSIDDPLFKEIVQYVEDSVSYGSPANDLAAYVPVMKVLDLFTGKKKKAEGERLIGIRDTLFKAMIKEAKESNTDSFIKTLYEIKDEHELDDNDIMVTMSDLTIAGTDTTSVSLSWAFLILMNRPNVQKKIHAELDAFVAEHNRAPTFDDRSRLPYLVAVQKECMRFRNITEIGMTHVTDEDIECQGYIIPKGAIVMCNMNGVHLNSEVFHDPEEFIPERFLDSQSTMYAAANGRLENRDHYQFGWGRRICPGIYLSETEMFIALIRVFVGYSLEPPLDQQGRSIKQDDSKAVSAGIVVTPAPYNVRFVERSERPRGITPVN
ncbi:cytochrome P450 [Zychaea mexicana]|uniref:cytochrome P450 n=1 Tax=Zychaea mexicana TaxID=64656 RepID=UPI0022FEF72B|nr:cytochrome P450 [Zychaea mexicana]KAI9477130.1 cytochrome P450 [Zychaea mexicana]